MEFKTALGFLGLIAIAVLVLIYLLKPNYQQKVISSTFLWKLSLKYKRKRIPVNRIRQVLLFVCQILLLTTAAIILTQPHLLNTAELPKNEKILVIDGSASMLATYDEQTRFERAIELAKREGESAIDGGGVVTIILADDKAGYALTDNGKAASRLTEKIQLSQALNNMKCSYARADINGAMRLAEDILLSNHTAQTYLYTAAVYQGVDDSVKVVDVSVRDKDGKWLERNAAILNAQANFVEGYYELEIQYANYNNDDAVQLTIVVDDFSYNIGEGKDFRSGHTQSLRNVRTEVCTAGEVTTLTVKELVDSENNGLKIVSFEQVTITITVDNDTFSYDNSFYIFGGKKQEIKILYVSTQPQEFLRRSLEALKQIRAQKWNVTVDTFNFDEEPSFNGYDLYIFEHQLPPGGHLPTDGVSILVDPNTAPQGGDFIINSTPTSGERYFLSLSDSEFASDINKISRGINPGGIFVSKYRHVLDVQDDVQQIMGHLSGDAFDPLILVKNTKESKYAVLSFDLHFSNLPVLLDFPVLLINLYDYFIPTTITKTENDIDVARFVFDVNEDITLNARGKDIIVSKVGSGTSTDDKAEHDILDKTIDKFPLTLSLDTPGRYNVTQNLLRLGDPIEESFYVRVNIEESNFNRMETFMLPSAPVAKPGLDLILYISAVLVGLLFIERILYIREEF